MVVGTAFGIGSSDYKMVDGGRMDLGYFPLILCILLTILGGAIALKATLTSTPVSTVSLVHYTFAALGAGLVVITGKWIVNRQGAASSHEVSASNAG